MSQSKLGNYVFVRTNAVAVHAPATSQTAQSLVGRTRWLWEHTTGSTAVPGEPAISPRNPQGDIGADLSGPPFGAAPRHVVATLIGDTSASSNARAQRGRFFQYDELEQSASSGLRHRNLTVVRFFNRPHTLSSANFSNPYQTLGFFYDMNFQTSANATTYRWTLENKTTGKSCTVTQTNSATNVATTVHTSLICAPGWNEVNVFLWRSAGPAVWTTVKSAMLCNMVKRRLGTA
jgi:hypothetical protein